MILDKQANKLMSSKCKVDYKHRHYWENIGVVGTRQMYQVWKCLQCGLCVSEELKFIIDIK